MATQAMINACNVGSFQPAWFDVAIDQVLMAHAMHLLQCELARMGILKIGIA